MSEKYKFRDANGVYFVTLTIVNWIDLFTRDIYCEILIDSLRYCQKNKGLQIHAWCIMPNHFHVIISSQNNELLSSTLRDLKKFTSKKIVSTIQNSNESRKEWLLASFEREARKIKRNSHFKVWRDGNHPVQLETNEMLEQKLDYIHENPVKARLCRDAVSYVWSSAINYSGLKGELGLVIIE